MNDPGRFRFVSEARRRRLKLGLCASLHALSSNDNWVTAMRTVWCVASCDKFISYFIYKYVWLFKNIPMTEEKNSSIVCSLLLHRVPFFWRSLWNPGQVGGRAVGEKMPECGVVT